MPIDLTPWRRLVCKTAPLGASCWLAVIAWMLLVTPGIAGDLLTLPEVERVALSHNARLKSTTAKWSLMKDRVPQARAWDDPMTGGANRTLRYDGFFPLQRRGMDGLPDFADFG